MATVMIQTSEIGISTFQPSPMNWSYRMRGSVARSHMKPKRNVHTFMTNHSSGHHPLFAPSIMLNGNGGCQPPRNSVVASAETVAMFTYSASMKIANPSDEYSVWKPPTSSPPPPGGPKG